MLLAALDAGFDRVPLSQFSTAGSRSRRTASWIVLILIGVADPDLSLLSAPASVGCRPLLHLSPMISDLSQILPVI